MSSPETIRCTGCGAPIPVSPNAIRYQCAQCGREVDLVRPQGQGGAPKLPKVHDGSAGSLFGVLLVAGAVAGGAYYALRVWHSNDDVEPIKPPPPAEPLAPQAALAPKSAATAASKSATAPAAGPAATAKAPGAPPKAERVEGEGFLDVLCKPECEIEIDGKPTGKRSPERGLRIAAGRHRLRLVNRPTSLSVTDVVEIRPEETTSKYYNLVLSATR